MGERRLPLLAASLALSIAMHGLVLGLPGWALPAPADSVARPLQATLVPPRPALAASPVPVQARPARPAKRPPKPKPVAPERPAVIAEAPLPEAVPEAAPEPVPEPIADPVPETASEPAPESAPEPPPEVAREAEPEPPLLPAGGPAWPRRGRIVYDVFRGDKDFLVGQTEHSWEQDGRRYRMKAVVETVGLAALMRDFRYVQKSEGRVTEWGLAPERFRVVQDGKREEAADFDWDAREAVVRRAKGKERRAQVRPGDQDVLSIWHQLALMGEPPPHRLLTLVSNKAATATELEALGVDVLELPIGHVIAHHLRARAVDGSLSVDIWLAEEYGYLPVRVRMRDRQGEIFDQRAREIVRDEGAPILRQENKTNDYPDGTP